MAAIPRLHHPSPETFRHEAFDPQLPVVITGATEGWPARAWTNEWLAAHVGSQEVTVNECVHGKTYAVDRASGLPIYTRRQMPFDAFARGATDTSEGLRYLQIAVCGKHEMFSTLPQLRDSIQYPEYVPKDDCWAVKLWLGPGGHFTGLHYDQVQNVLVQLRGTKRFTLYRPEDTEYLYHCPLDAKREFNSSMVDVQSPDLMAFPKFRFAQPYEVELQPGEMLYIPAFWWHAVESVGDNLALNFWWFERVNALHAGYVDVVRGRFRTAPLKERPEHLATYARALKATLDQRLKGGLAVVW